MARIPLGVALLAVLNLITGVLLLVGSTPLLADFNWLLLIALLRNIPYSVLIIGIIYILLCVGLLSLARWAWYADIIFAIFNLILIALDIISMGTIHLNNIAWIPLILNLIIVLYLNQYGIRRKFNI